LLAAVELEQMVVVAEALGVLFSKHLLFRLALIQ
jgi:hypothetical protein